MWMPGIWELVIILLIVLITFGAGKLPQVGRSLGSAINEFKDSVAPKKDEDEKDGDSASKSDSEPAAAAKDSSE